MKPISTLGLALAWTATACLAQPDDGPVGTWKGTIGSASVSVCITPYGEAQYYYLRHLRGIPLAAPTEAAGTPQAMQQAWQQGRLELQETERSPSREVRVTGRWVLQRRSATEATGTWTDPSGGRPTPITLSRQSDARTSDPRLPGSACGPAYYAPIRTSVRTQSAPAKLDGQGYRTLTSPQGTSFEVPADLPHAARLNRHALDWLRDQAVNAFDCDLNRGGPPAPWEASLLPMRWTDQVIVLRDLLPETYCGGAHGFWSQTYATWSVPQGRLVDTWTWLRGGQQALKAGQDAAGTPRPSALFRLLVRLHPRNVADDSCREAMDHMSVDAPYPGAEGLVFNTGFSHAMRACSEEVTLPWKQAGPFLSEAGRAVVPGR